MRDDGYECPQEKQVFQKPEPLQRMQSYARRRAMIQGLQNCLVPAHRILKRESLTDQKWPLILQEKDRMGE